MADAKKYLFWIVSSIVTVTVGVLWFLAIGQLNDQRTQQTSSINSVFSDLGKIKSVNESNHPNDDFQDGMEEIMTQVKFDIHRTWEAKYTTQKTAFNWPTAEGELPQVTANQFIPLTPIELKVTAGGVINPNNKDVSVEVNRIARTNYADFVKDYMPKLASRIDAAWGEPQIEGEGFGGAVGGFGGETTGGDPTGGGNPTVQQEVPSRMVVWEENNQKALDARFTFTETPSTLSILYTQEDLWVLQQWLSIIENLNKEAEAAYNAKVTEIIGIDLAKNGDLLGPSGVDLAKESILSGGKIVAGEAGGDDGGIGGMDMMQQMGTMAPEGGENSSGSSDNSGGNGEKGNLVASDDPGDLRYVDDKYQPLQVTALRDALDPEARTPKPELAIAKRYPTRIRLKLDMRYLSQFLAECGNAELSIEVLQVRIGGESGINKGGAAAGGTGGMEGGAGMEGGMGGAMGGAMGGTDGGMGGAMGGMMGGMEGGMGGAVVQASEHPYHQEVEVYGIVNIYNPPNPLALGINPDDQPAGADNGGNGPAPGQGEPLDAGAE